MEGGHEGGDHRHQPEGVVEPVRLVDVEHGSQAEGAAGVDGLAGRSFCLADRDDPAVPYPHRAGESRRPGAVDNEAATNHHVMRHQNPPVR